MHWEDPEESGGEGGGRGGLGWGIHVTPWLIHVNVWQNPLQCCEVISLQLIKKKSSPFWKLNEMTHKMCAWHNSLKYSLLRLLMLLMLKVLLRQYFSSQISALVPGKIMKLNWKKKWRKIIFSRPFSSFRVSFPCFCIPKYPQPCRKGISDGTIWRYKI